MSQDRQPLSQNMVNQILLHLAETVDAKITTLCEGYRKLKACFELGADPRATNPKGETAAHILARRNCFVGVHVVVEASEAVLEITDEDSMTPILWLAAHQCPELDDYVEARPHYLKQADHSGRSVAWFYATAGDIDRVTHFANLCADVRMQGIKMAVLHSPLLSAMEKRDACEALAYAGF